MAQPWEEKEGPVSQQPGEGASPQYPGDGAAGWDFETLMGQAEREDEGAAGDAPPSREPPPGGYGAPPGARAANRRTVLKLLLSITLILVACLLALSTLRRNSPALDMRDWLEEDFGVELESSDHNDGREDTGCLYWLKDDSQVRFQARLDGERGEGQPGYHTNYTQAMLYWAVKEFAGDWPDCPLWFDAAMTDSVGEGADGGAPPVSYLFQIPDQGAEDFLAALGAELEELARTDWYQTLPPEFQLTVVHGDIVLYDYLSPEDGAFSADALLKACGDEAGFTLLHDLVFRQEAAQWDFAQLDEVTVARYGYVTFVGEQCWWMTCYGRGLTGERVVMNYYLPKSLAALYCVPEGAFDQEELITMTCTETMDLDCGRSLEVYRLV